MVHPQRLYSDDLFSRIKYQDNPENTNSFSPFGYGNVVNYPMNQFFGINYLSMNKNHSYINSNGYPLFQYSMQNNNSYLSRKWSNNNNNNKDNFKKLKRKSTYTERTKKNENQNKNSYNDISLSAQKPNKQNKKINKIDTNTSCINTKGINKYSSDSSSNNQSNQANEIEEFNFYLQNLPSDVTSYLCSQKGARDMHKTLQKYSFHIKTLLLSKIGNHLPKIMCDIYGNYFCQLFIHDSQQDLIVTILQTIQPYYVSIAKDYSGTHVLQAILDEVTSNEQQMLILNAIKSYEFEMAYDNNATHVLQKIIMTIPDIIRIRLNELILSNLKELSLHSNGICLVKKFISTCTLVSNKKQILQILIDGCIEISQSPFGNYAIQFIIEEWGTEQCFNLIKTITDNISVLSTQKFSSNVVEKIIELIDDKNKISYIKNLFYGNKLLTILKNKYGRFVLQKAIKHVEDPMRGEIKNRIGNLEPSNAKEKNRIKAFLSCLEDISD